MELRLNLQNCYGIGALQATINYPANGNTAVVYAPNGTMKTSLTKTFNVLLSGKEPCDDFYPDRASSAAISKANTYVFTKDDPDCSKQISAFLANEALKNAYDAIYSQLDAQKKALKKKSRNWPRVRTARMR